MISWVLLHVCKCVDDNVDSDYAAFVTFVGQASSPTAESAGAAAHVLADIGWKVASSTVTSSGRDVTAISLPVSVSGLSGRAQDFHRRVKRFIREHILPVEQDVLNWHSNPQTKWSTHPRVEQLKVIVLYHSSFVG